MLNIRLQMYFKAMKATPRPCLAELMSEGLLNQSHSWQSLWLYIMFTLLKERKKNSVN